MLNAPVAKSAGPCVTAVIGDTPVLSLILTRSCEAAIVIATVGDTVPRPNTRLRVNEKPELALVVELEVYTDRKLNTEDRSRNSQLSIENSWQPEVIVVEVTVWEILT